MGKRPTLTVFTCTYNRAHTIVRTYESLCRQTNKDFVWLIIDDGSTDRTDVFVKEWQSINNGFEICYVFKENGGLHTGYNKAIELMDTELCVCIDSDDWMPDDAVDNILLFWKQYGSDEFAGVIGLDCYTNGCPIGGQFPNDLRHSYIALLDNYHRGDVKMVHRTKLLKAVAPMVSFPGERFANPIYLFIKVDMKYPMLLTNQCFCIVDYQDANDSMSKNILYQYAQSPRSFARLRLLKMQHPHDSYYNKLRNAIHYISSCLFCGDKDWLANSPMKLTTLLAVPFGIILHMYIRYKNQNKKNLYK